MGGNNIYLRELLINDKCPAVRHKIQLKPLFMLIYESERGCNKCQSCRA